MFSKQLHINQTWNGEVLAVSEHVRLLMRLDQNGLHVQVEAPFYNDPPPESAPGTTEGLWEYEVVELFLLGAGGHYLEIELGPHGHYLVYYLSDVRQVERVVEPLFVDCMTRGGRWQGEIHLGLTDLPEQLSHVNGYGIHGQGGGRRYLSAAPLPGATPDFHQPQAFLPLETLVQ